MMQETLAVATTVAEELRVPITQVNAAIALLDDGATVPFIARYRKEATGGLNDTQLRVLNERLYYLRELNTRRASIIETIREAQKLTSELEQALFAAKTKTELEDLYLPFRPKRRTKASIAEEAGLAALAEALLSTPDVSPESMASAFINQDKGIVDISAALDGARHILMERFSENASLLNELRVYFWEHAVLKSTSAKTKSSSANKYADYFDYAEPIKQIPSHRALALFRGRREQAIQFALTLPDAEYGEKRLAVAMHIENQTRLADAWLMETVRLTWKTKLFNKLELESLSQLRELADEEAIRVFSRNLRALLLAAPAGHVVTIGLDPGIRTGVKAAVVDATGKLLDEATVFPFAPQNEWNEAITTLAKLISKHHVRFISIGNGTGSRDTTRLITELMKRYSDMDLTPVLVNEAGASVYSASELAAEEFPDLDVTLRGAVSIARRLQDPLAELVKIDPKAIGVGQYQHDVNQVRLVRRLQDVVEDCVNAVGVDVNTASAALLTYVSGCNETLAKNIVAFRDEHGPFDTREKLKHVARMGDKTFQQSAGFLRILNGTNPLDASGVHPEAYPLVERILADGAVSIQTLMGNGASLRQIDAARYVDDTYGILTIRDVLQELEKPGRDPRPLFKTPRFQEGVEELSHVKEGMVLEGVVSNVTNFGAFVDIGVHQDGLVHISALTDRFVRDPQEIVKAGDIVRVKVIEVDIARRRIGLSMKFQEENLDASSVIKIPAKAKVAKPPVAAEKRVVTASSHAARKKTVKKEPATKPHTNVSSHKTPFNTAMADAFAKLKRESS
jgi:uncharacterized protein